MLNVATGWKGRKNARWSVTKCAHLKLAQGKKGLVYLDGEPLKVASNKTYLEMSLESEGLRLEGSMIRRRGAGTEKQEMLNSDWWILKLSPS